jgi:hypothetical protein
MEIGLARSGHHHTPPKDRRGIPRYFVLCETYIPSP